MTGTSSRPISVVVVDDHGLVREGLCSLLDHMGDIEVVGEAASVGDAVAVVLDVAPDLVLLDLRLGEEDGNQVARRLRAEGADAKILVLSVHDTPRHLREALAAGADGYLLKSVSSTELAAGIRKAAAGETVIGEEFVPKLIEDATRELQQPAVEPTAREREVLELLAEGLSNRAVAEQLGMSPRTAQKHVENLFQKLAVHDRTELVSQAFRRGLLG